MFRVLVVVLVCLSVSVCETSRFPGVHRITIQQGNVITQQMIDKLRPGMSRSQVRFVLGNAVIDDQLDADRWDYIYTVDVPDQLKVQRVLTVYFVEDKLSYFTGNFVPTDEFMALQAASQG